MSGEVENPGKLRAENRYTNELSKILEEFRENSRLYMAIPIRKSLDSDIPGDWAFFYSVTSLFCLLTHLPSCQLTHFIHLPIHSNMLSGSHLFTPPSCQQLRLSFLQAASPNKKKNSANFKYCIFTFKLVPMYKQLFSYSLLLSTKQAAFYNTNDPWEGKPLAGCPRRCSNSIGKLSI